MTNVRRTYKLIDNQTGEIVRVFPASFKIARIHTAKTLLEDKTNKTYKLEWFYNMDDLYPHEVRELTRRQKINN